MALSLGWDLVVPIAAGALLGYWLDRNYQTGPGMTAVALLLGAAAGYVNVIRLLRRLDRSLRRRPSQDDEREGARWVH